MSTTLSPARPARSPTPVLNEEDAELQAFLAAAQREAHKKWRRLREEKVSGNVVDGWKVVEKTAVVEEDVGGEVEVEKEEIIPKVKPRPQKAVNKMVAGLPHGSGIILVPKKRRNVVEAEVAESSQKRQKVVQILTPTPSPSPFLVPANDAFVATRFVALSLMLTMRLLKSKRSRVRSPPNESDWEEKRELCHAIEELTVQVRALVRQGQKGREGRGDCRADRKGKGKRRESTPETDHYSSE
ncbi:hypothetical protein GGU11DRAFT_750738 [Lentinula aff. detonsa]|nr:hypothetical protein GGU11DRAFT_750738 [Lentinula aff. detonsa]